MNSRNKKRYLLIALAAVLMVIGFYTFADDTRKDEGDVVDSATILEDAKKDDGGSIDVPGLTQQPEQREDQPEQTQEADDAPVTDAPSTDAPSTDAPVTDAPSTDAPSTDAPSTDAPSTDAPATDTPATDTPATDTPATDAPTTDTPSTDAPEEDDALPTEAAPTTLQPQNDRGIEVQSSLADMTVINLGEEFILTAVLTGYEDLQFTAMWQFSADGGITWNDYPESNTLVLKVAADINTVNNQWRIQLSIDE